MRGKVKPGLRVMVMGVDPPRFPFGPVPACGLHAQRRRRVVEYSKILRGMAVEVSRSRSRVTPRRRADDGRDSCASFQMRVMLEYYCLSCPLQDMENRTKKPPEPETGGAKGSLAEARKTESGGGHGTPPRFPTPTKNNNPSEYFFPQLAPRYSPGVLARCLPLRPRPLYIQYSSPPSSSPTSHHQPSVKVRRSSSKRIPFSCSWSGPSS